MFRTKNVPVLLAIVLLSGMFLMGQESWNQPSLGNLSGHYQATIDFESGYGGTVTITIVQVSESQVYAVLLRTGGDFETPNGFTLDGGSVVSNNQIMGSGVSYPGGLESTWSLTVTDSGALSGTIHPDNGNDAFLTSGYRISDPFQAGANISGYYQASIDFDNGYNGTVKIAFLQIGTDVYGTLLRIGGNFVSPHGITLDNGYALSDDELGGTGVSYPGRTSSIWSVLITPSGSLSGDVSYDTGLEAFLDGYRISDPFGE